MMKKVSLHTYINYHADFEIHLISVLITELKRTITNYENQHQDTEVNQPVRQTS